MAEQLEFSLFLLTSSSKKVVLEWFDLES